MAHSAAEVARRMLIVQDKLSSAISNRGLQVGLSNRDMIKECISNRFPYSIS